MQTPKPINIDPVHKVQTDLNTLIKSPKLRIIKAYNKNLLILKRCENLFTKTEQLANIRSGIDVSILLCKLSK